MATPPNLLTNTQGSEPSLEERRFEQETAAKRRELDLREREVIVREREPKRWWANPMIIALISASALLLANFGVAWVNDDLALKQQKEKNQHDLFIAAIRTDGDNDAACDNLLFLIRLKSLDDPRGTITSTCQKHPEQIPVLPSGLPSVPRPTPQSGDLIIFGSRSDEHSSRDGILAVAASESINGNAHGQVDIPTLIGDLGTQEAFLTAHEGGTAHPVWRSTGNPQLGRPLFSRPGKTICLLVGITATTTGGAPVIPGGSVTELTSALDRKADTEVHTMVGADATWDKVRNAMKDLRGHVSDADDVIVYWGGLNDVASDGAMKLLTYNSTTTGWLRLSELLENTKRIGGRRRILLLDMKADPQHQKAVR